jgi:hypothetical protein
LCGTGDDHAKKLILLTLCGPHWLYSVVENSGRAEIDSLNDCS